MKAALRPAGPVLVLAVLLGVGLTLKPREVPSPFIGKPAPAFAAAAEGRPAAASSRPR
jgi:cytochrome c biogenesis protein CcmG/thiol:disulfide interchange protein DsbE